MTSDSWRPLLKGEHAEHVLRIAERIGDDLEWIARQWVDSSPMPGFCSLGSGFAGFALYFAYLDRALPGRGYDEKSIEHLERALNHLNRDPAPATLFAGFPGIAWCLEHLQNMLFSPEEMDPGYDAATAIADHLDSASCTRSWGLLDGLAGLGVYALERLPRPRGEEGVKLVVSRLSEGSELCAEGTSWRTPASQLLSHVRDQYPEGNFNLGMALGVPGIIAFLSEVCAAGFEDQALTRKAVAWLIAQKLPLEADARFPYTVAGAVAGAARPVGRQLAWCYGDLGIAVALLGAARHLGEVAWEGEALAIASSAARRPIEDVRAIDACLCHGTAGILHLFNRIYQATHDEQFRLATEAWLTQTLTFPISGRGVGGFRSWHAASGEEGQWRDDPGLLTGAAGVGLALLAAVSPTEPGWDRLILARIPQR